MPASSTPRLAALVTVAVASVVGPGCPSDDHGPRDRVPTVIACEACLDLPSRRCEWLRLAPRGTSEAHTTLELGGFALGLHRAVEYPGSLEVGIHVSAVAPRMPIWSVSAGDGSAGAELPADDEGFLGVQRIHHPSDASTLELRCKAERAGGRS